MASQSSGGDAPLKILVVSNLYPPDIIGGYELGCKQAVDALRDRGHDVRVLTTTPRTPTPSVSHVHRDLQLSDVWNDYLYAHNAPITSRLLQIQSSLVNAVNVHALTQVAQTFDPDVVYVWNLVGVGGIGLMAAIQHLQIPWVWHLMDDVPLELCHLAGDHPPALVGEVSRQLNGQFLACSRQLVNEIERGGVRLGPAVEIVPNWVVGDHPEPRTRGYHAGTGDPLRIMAAGQINRNKGVDLLIEAAALLRSAGHDDFVINLFGQVKDPFFAALARVRDVDQHVHFLGSRPQAELGQLYAEHDLFAFPTWAREPFGFAPLEAAWQGCVPLLSQQCGFAEWFVSGVHCLKADRTPTAFAESITSILSGATDLRPIAHRVAAVVGRDFHLATTIPKIEQALVQASERTRAPAGSAADAYRMALLAEKLARVFVAEIMTAA